MQQKRLNSGARSLDIQARQEMNKILGEELVAYVGELRQAIEASTPSQSDTAASGDSREARGANNLKILRELDKIKYN